MKPDDARKWIIVLSLLILGTQMVFLLLAPLLGLPLVYPRNLEILQTVTPVFLGYLGAASHFVFRDPKPRREAKRRFLEFLVFGPLLIYSVSVMAAFTAFFLSNKRGAPIGSGMSVENLNTALVIALGLLAATTGVITSYLFSVEDSEKVDPV